MTKVTPFDIRSARGFLQTAGIGTAKLSPRHLASVSQEIGKGYRQTLKYLNLLLAGGSGEGPSPTSTADEDRLDPINALGDNSPSRKTEYSDVS
jgi:hypothetical protein